ncbi:hypothetical protein ACFVAJ_18760 [Agromyces sp. NPDC057679]|uniref:hypothetical protein n=1 Tax=Agromyces sp. NPDC057679 TaxID=3346207 RepID=UPI003670ECEA
MLNATTDVGCGALTRTAHQLEYWDITAWEEPVNPEAESFDRTVVTDRTIAVLDGAVNYAHLEGEARTRDALEVTVQALRENPMPKAFAVATSKIHRPDEPYRHRSGLVAAAAVELGFDEITGYRAADCEVWANTGGEWVNLFPHHMLTDEGQAVMAAGPAQDGAHAWWKHQEIELDDLTLWRYPTLGLDRAAKFVSASLYAFEVDEIVIASDGAELNAARMTDLEPWVEEGIHARKPQPPHRFPHGDITVIRAKRRF